MKMTAKDAKELTEYNIKKKLIPDQIKMLHAQIKQACEDGKYSIDVSKLLKEVIEEFRKKGFTISTYQTPTDHLAYRISWGD